MTSRWNRPGLWFGVFVTALAAVLVVDVLVVDSARSSGTRGDGPHVLDDRVVTVREVQAGPGDVVRVDAAVGGDAFDRYTFYAVEHGEGQAYLSGGSAEHVYAQASGAAEEHASNVVYIVRPDAPSGADGAWLDLVWVVEYAGGVSRPEGAEARDYFDRWVTVMLVDRPSPEVTDSVAVASHSYVGVPLIVLLSLAVVATGLWWLRGLVAAPDDVASDEPAASGVALARLGGRYLDYLRALFFGVGLPLLYVGWLTLFFFANQVVETPGPSSGWGGAVMAGVYVALAALLVGWLAATWRVTRSHRRWRQLMMQRPVDL